MDLVDHYANIEVYREDCWMGMVRRLARALQAVQRCKQVVDEEEPPSSESLQALAATRNSAHSQAMQFIDCVIKLSGSRRVTDYEVELLMLALDQSSAHDLAKLLNLIDRRTNPGRRRDFIVIKSGRNRFRIESPVSKQAAPATS